MFGFGFSLPTFDLLFGWWLFLGLASRSRLCNFFDVFFGVFFGVFFVVFLFGVFFNGFVGVFFDVDFVRGFGVVRAYALGASGISTGIVSPRGTGLSWLGNGLIWSGAGHARRWLWSGAGHARRCLSFGLVS